MLGLTRRLFRSVFARPAPARRGRVRFAPRLTALEGRDVPTAMLYVPNDDVQVFQVPAGQNQLTVNVSIAVNQPLGSGVQPGETLPMIVTVVWDCPTSNDWQMAGPIPHVYAGEGDHFVWSTNIPHTFPGGVWHIQVGGIAYSGGFDPEIGYVGQWVGGIDPIYACGIFNRQPVPVPDEIVVHAGQTVWFDPLENDSDPDHPDFGGRISLAGVDPPARGTLTQDWGYLTYTAPQVISGTEETYTVSYTVIDDYGGSSSAGRITFRVVNALPVADPVEWSVMAGGEGTGSVSATDPDWDDSVTLVSVGSAGHGTVTVGPGLSFHYQTNSPYFDGTDSFTYTVADDHGGTSTNTVTVTVVPAQVYVAASQHAAEDDGDGGVVSGVYTLTRPAESALHALTIPFQYASGVGLAEPGTDFNTGAMSVTFPAGQTTAVLTVVPKKDNRVEETELIRAVFEAGSGYSLNDLRTNQTVNLNLYDDPPVVTVSAARNAGEGWSLSGQFVFTRTGGNRAESLTVGIEFDGTAANSADIQSLPTSVTFGAGQSTCDLDIVPIDDTIFEDMEFVTVTIVLPAGTSEPPPYLGAGGSATLTVADNEVKVHKLTYGGPTLITIHPGPGDAPFTTDLPHWLDQNLDGETVESIGDRNWPVGYVRNSQINLSPVFAVASGVTLVSGMVFVKGTGPGGLNIPSTAARVEGGQVVLDPTNVTGLLPNVVKYYQPFTVEWQVSFDGEATWNRAGKTANEVMSILEPSELTTMHYAYISTATAAADGAGDKPSVIEKIWNGAFSGQKHKTNKRSPDGKLPVETPLYYYKDWNGTVATAHELIDKGNGDCFAWADLFGRYLMAAGVKQADIKTADLTPTRQAGEPAIKYMLIKNWEFAGNGPYVNVYAQIASAYKKLADGTWAYDFHTADVTDKPGVNGQNTANPLAHFQKHRIILISDKYYDPSYGKAYDTIQQWEDGSVSGFALHGINLARQVPEWIIQTNPNGLNVEEAIAPFAPGG